MAHKLLLTPVAVRKELGVVYSQLRRRFDPLITDRLKTGKVGSKVFSRSNGICAVCGRNQNAERRLEFAHIVPLSECGPTIEDNLVLLCRNSADRINKMGCHDLYDRGCASVDEIIMIRRKWDEAKEPKPQLRVEMIKRYEKHRDSRPFIGAKEGSSVQELKSRGATRKARNEQRRIVNSSLESADLFNKKLKLAELLRRAAAKGCLEESETIFAELRNKTYPHDSRFWYEAGYVEMLLGRHQQAQTYFDKSLNSINKNQKHWEGRWAAAEALIIQCIIAQQGENAPLEELYNRMVNVCKISNKSGETHGKRWINNALWHILNIVIFIGDKKLATGAYEQAISHWHSMTVEDGWDQGSRPTLLTITGELKAEWASSEGEARDALRFLTRALVHLVGRPINTFEKLRDLLFAIVKALYVLDMNEMSLKVQDVASRTRDGSSWRYPYRSNQ